MRALTAGFSLMMLLRFADAQQQGAIYTTASDSAYFRPASALSTAGEPGKWFQRRVAFAARGDYILQAQAGAAYPDLIVTPGLRGRYNLYVNLREIDQPSSLQLKLSADELAYTITPARGTETVHTNREILWATNVDLTGQTILIHYCGRVVYFNYLKFVPCDRDEPNLVVDPARVQREPLWDAWAEWARTSHLVPEGMVELKYVPQQPQTPADDDVRGYVITSRPYLDLVFPNTPAAAGDVVSQLRLAAAPGEYEPVSFAVHASRELGACRVSVSDLRQGNRTLGREAIQVAAVVCHNLRTSFRGKVFMYAPARLQVGSSVTIPAGRTQQFWLTVHVPPGTAPGQYVGTVSLTPEKASATDLPLIVRVYPCELADPQGVALGMYDTLWSARLDPTWLRDRFADMRAHGMTTVGYCGDVNGRIELRAGRAEVVFDGSSRLEQVMAAYQQAGFSQPLLWLMGNEIWQWCSAQAEPGSEQFAAVYRQVIDSILQQVRRRGWPGIVFQPVDEPGSSGRRGNAHLIESWAEQCRLIKEAGGTVEVDHIPLSTTDPRLQGALERALPHLDIFTQRFSTRPIWFEQDGWWWDRMREQIAKWGKQLWSYNINDAHFFPELATLRLAYGFFIWQQQVGGQLLWVYQSASENPLNCLDGTYTDMMYTWPSLSQAGFAGGPSLMWECIREGVDDLRYLHTLEQLIRQAEAEGREASAQRARALLSQLAGSFDFEQLRAHADYLDCRWEQAQIAPSGGGTVSGSFQVPIGWDLADYDRWRRRIADEIVRLSTGR